jgi:hypothetical protein
MFLDVIDAGFNSSSNLWRYTTPVGRSQAQLEWNPVPYYVHAGGANFQCADGHNQRVNANGSAVFYGVPNVDPGTTGYATSGLVYWANAP